MIRQPFLMKSSVVLLLLQPWLAMAQSNQPWARSEWPGPWHMWAGGWGLWWLFPILMFGLMIFLCAFFMRRGPWGQRDRHADTTGSALTLLSERFAKGDISKEEFEEKKSILVRRV